MIAVSCSRTTSLSFSARLQSGRVTFSCVAKRKSPKRRPPRCCAFRPSMDERCVRSGRACRRAFRGAAASGRTPLRPPCRPDRPDLTAAQGPHWRASCAPLCRRQSLGLASNEAMDGHEQSRAPRRRWRCRSHAAERAGKARMFEGRMPEFAPAHERQVARAVERTRRSFDHRLRRLGLWLLSAETESSPLAAGASETRYGQCVLASDARTLWRRTGKGMDAAQMSRRGASTP